MSKLLNVDAVRNELNISKSKAYQIIKQLNSEMEKAGFMVIKGKVDKEYFNHRFFYNKEETQQKNVKLRC